MENSVRLQMRLLFCLTNLLIQSGSIVADSCTPSNTCRTCRECSGVSNQFHVMKNGRVNLTCDGDPGDNPWFHITETSNTSIIRGSSRYRGSSNWLEISVVVPEDEGRYECQVGDSVWTAGCVFVLGMGMFAQCAYHWHPDYCGREQISVQAGSTIVFDVRVMFINSGPCGLPQNTGYLQFYKGEFTARNNVYTCSIRDIRCPETSKNSAIRAVWGGGHRLNLNLTKAYATVDDEALYTVSLGLYYKAYPQGHRILIKEFQVNIAALFAVLATSSQNLTVDRDLGKPLLVAPRVGGLVALFAVVNTGSCPTVQWRVNGGAISHSDAGYVIGNPCSSVPVGTATFNFTLTITVTTVTAGTYNATLTNAAGTREVPDVFVTPPVLPSIVDLPSPMTHTKGDHFELVCSFTGIPAPEIHWEKNGSVLLLGEGMRVINTSGRSQLEINNLTLSDAGVYSCSVTNVAGNVTRSVRLEVEEGRLVSTSPPTTVPSVTSPGVLNALFALLTTSSQKLTIDRDLGKPLLVAPMVGGQVTLFAVVTADSCPTIQWRVNGSVVSGADYTLNDPCSSAPAGTTTFNFTLTITANSATAGTYNATLSNAAGTREVPDVFVTPPVPVVITEIQLLSDSHCLMNGTSVNIKCVNSGFPRPEIVFLKGTEQITPGTGNFSNFEAVEGEFDTVRLTTARQEDGGEYVCVARMGNVELDRSQPKTLVFCTRPTIVELPGPTTHTEGERFELVCIFTGFPAPEVHWEKDGSVFLLGEGRRIINSTGRSQLVINDLVLSDSGVYSCLVINDAGVDRMSVTLEVGALSSLSSDVIAGVVVGTIIGLGISAFFCAILVAGRVLKRKTPAASPCVDDIPLHGNIAYESYNDEDEPADNHSYERMD